MEFWLSYNNGAEKLQLPVPPPEYTISKGHINQTINVNDVGEINLIGKPGLAIVSLASFFPARYYSFCQYRNFLDPYDIIGMINRWKESGKPIRLIITSTDINMPVSIENFEYGERGGSRDVDFTLELKEYKFLSVTGTKSNAFISMTNGTTTIARPVTQETPKEYVVKAGDSLWTIAKLLTGNGANYVAIASKNGINDPAKIYPGQKLVIS